MSKHSVAMALLLLASVADGAVKKAPRQVIDLGQLEIDGAARGPEIQLIDPQQADGKTASRLVRRQLEELERELLRSELLGGKR